MNQSPSPSPNALAEASYTAARDALIRGEDTGGGDVVRPTKFPRTTTAMATDSSDRRDNDATGRIEEIWKGTAKVDDKMAKTLQLLVGEIDSLMKSGVEAFYDLDATERELMRSKELAETRSREAQRLHEIDKQSRASLSNLLRAVESSKDEARNSSRSAQLEARLRAEMNSIRDERDAARSEVSELRRKLSLFEEELRLTKAKLTRITSEKINLERDSRVAVSLARSLDKSNSNESAFYKNKAGDLADKNREQSEEIRRLTATITELRRQATSHAPSKRMSY